MKRPVVLVAATACLLAPGTAAAAVPVTVQPGETLWSIAQRNGLDPSAVAAFNGLSAEHRVVSGSTLQVPGAGEVAPAAATPSATSGAAPAAMGGYTVQPGDTLTGLAARSGTPAAVIAQMNGLAPDAPLVSGTALKLPTGAPGAGSSASTAPTADAQSSPTPAAPEAAPQATGARVSSGDVATVAAQHGVPSALASAIGWQESGFNNSAVSSAGARGVMQVMPGTWDYVQQNLAQRKLDPGSATDNVHAGVLYLRRLLADAGGDEATAIASYYQGGGSVRRIGMLPETQRYVANVQALKARFGG